MSRKQKKKPASVLNWMGTLILYGIPGVNLIAAILTIAFAKTKAKRNSAIALLILIILFAALTVAAFIVFPEKITELATKLRGTPATETIQLPEL